MSKPTKKADEIPTISHGSRSTYINHKCRCEACKLANAMYVADFRLRHTRNATGGFNRSGSNGATQSVRR